MSSTMSEHEIENVLASVRRLVAEEERRSRLAPLVLTPEMRVQDRAAEPPRAAPVPDPMDAAPASAPPAETPDAAHQAAQPPAVQASGTLPAARSEAGLPTLLDDDALQALVAQAVRDELHGKLGERITLAVRKLVRNEIARALDEARRK